MKKNFIPYLFGVVITSLFAYQIVAQFFFKVTINIWFVLDLVLITLAAILFPLWAKQNTSKHANALLGHIIAIIGWAIFLPFIIISESELVNESFKAVGGGIMGSLMISSYLTVLVERPKKIF